MSERRRSQGSTTTSAKPTPPTGTAAAGAATSGTGGGKAADPRHESQGTRAQALRRAQLQRRRCPEGKPVSPWLRLWRGCLGILPFCMPEPTPAEAYRATTRRHEMAIFTLCCFKTNEALSRNMSLFGRHWAIVKAYISGQNLRGFETSRISPISQSRCLQNVQCHPPRRSDECLSRARRQIIWGIIGYVHNIPRKHSRPTRRETKQDSKCV